VEVEVKVEGRRPRCKQTRESLKAAEDTQQRKEGLLDTSKKAKAKAKAPAKRRKPGKKAL